MTHYSRSDWGAAPARSGPGLLVPANVDGIALHHHGGGPVTGKAHVIRALQSWQRFHFSKGWSDIAYQVAIDQAGNRWELRGLGHQSAANGDQDVNRRFGAALLIVGDSETPSADMIAEVRAVVRDFRRKFPGGRRVVGHRDIRPDPTSCPGESVMDLIHAGAFAPGSTEGDDMTPDQLLEALESPRGQKALTRAMGALMVDVPESEQDTYGKEPRPIAGALTRVWRLVASK